MFDKSSPGNYAAGRRLKDVGVNTLDSIAHILFWFRGFGYLVFGEIAYYIRYIPCGLRQLPERAAQIRPSDARPGCAQELFHKEIEIPGRLRV
jgi:hypothetical protein